MILALFFAALIWLVGSALFVIPLCRSAALGDRMMAEARKAKR